VNAPPAYVLDTSVAVKWFADEGGPEQANAVHLYQAFEEGRCRLRAPELLFFEIANALIYSYKLPGSKVLESLDSLWQLKIDVEPLHWPTFTKAVEIASACGATIYDSYFLALALETDSLLVTADQVFLRKVRHLTNIISLRLLRLSEHTP
jgi:predicted nucleic acid-binding protein